MWYFKHDPPERPQQVSRLAYFILLFSPWKKRKEKKRKEQKQVKVDKDIKIPFFSSSYTKSEVGWLFFHQNQLEKAAQSLKEAIESKDDEPLFFYRLARIYWEMGGEFKTEKASSSFTLTALILADL